MIGHKGHTKAKHALLHSHSKRVNRTESRKAKQSQRPNGHKTKMSLSASLGLDRIESFPAKFSCCPLNYVIWFLETEFENKCKKEGHSSTLVFKPPCILGSEISTENIVFLKSAVFFSGCSCAFTNGHCPD